MADRPIAIIGPTASGKTAVAIELARRLDGEVISMDSRQVYRGMDIGTAKPDMAERAGVPHHGFDLIDPDARYSAGRFARDARSWIGQIRSRGHIPVLAGGTGFFLRALTVPLFEEPELDGDRRDALKEYLDGQSIDMLRAWARALDPERAAVARDRQRYARIVEIALLTGRPLSWWHDHARQSQPPVDFDVFVLDVPRDELADRIGRRVRAMIAGGLRDEVSRLLDNGFDAGDPGMNATGYIEMIGCILGERDLDETAELIETATRQYARRQRTWLRNQLPEGSHWLDGSRPADAIVSDILARVGGTE